MIIIDGHNAVFRTHAFKQNDMPHAVEGMSNKVLAITERIQKKTILVFDGTGGLSHHGTKQKKGSYLTIAFSGTGYSADDWIVSWISNHPEESVTLVSDDQKLKERSKRPGVQFSTIHEWFNKQTPKPSAKPSQKKQFGSVDHWLKEFGIDE